MFDLVGGSQPESQNLTSKIKFVNWRHCDGGAFKILEKKFQEKNPNWLHFHDWRADFCMSKLQDWWMSLCGDSTHSYSLSVILIRKFALKLSTSFNHSKFVGFHHQMLTTRSNYNSFELRINWSVQFEYVAEGEFGISRLPEVACWLWLNQISLETNFIFTAWFNHYTRLLRSGQL